MGLACQGADGVVMTRRQALIAIAPLVSLQSRQRPQATLTIDLGLFDLIVVRHPSSREPYAIDPRELWDALIREEA